MVRKGVEFDSTRTNRRKKQNLDILDDASASHKLEHAIYDGRPHRLRTET